MKNLALRAVSGTIYVCLIIGALLGGLAWSTALFSLFCVLAMTEFQGITLGPVRSGMDVAIRAVDTITALAFCNICYILDFPTPVTIAVASLVLGYTLIRFTLALYHKTTGATDALTEAAWSTLSLLYIAMPLSMLGMLCTEAPGNMMVLVMFIMIWLNDTGAYCVGSLCGRHKLFERLSPKKSWEGLFGGLAFCLAAGAGAYYILGPVFPLAGWLGIGAMVCVLSTWGDLFESLLKRTHGIKDSGKLIPGHGGILDRIDSMLFASIGIFIIMFFNDLA